MASVPDVIGLPLDEARERLRTAGIDVHEVVESMPPGLGSESPRRGGLAVAGLAGPLRVIRVRGNGPVALVVTRERYVSTPPSP